MRAVRRQRTPQRHRVGEEEQDEGGVVGMRWECSRRISDAAQRLGESNKKQPNEKGPLRSLPQSVCPSAGVATAWCGCDQLWQCAWAEPLQLATLCCCCCAVGDPCAVLLSSRRLCGFPPCTLCDCHPLHADLMQRAHFIVLQWPLLCAHQTDECSAVQRLLGPAASARLAPPPQQRSRAEPCVSAACPRLHQRACTLRT